MSLDRYACELQMDLLAEAYNLDAVYICLLIAIVAD